MLILNKSDPKTEPCGTPCNSSAQELKLSQVLVHCRLLERIFVKIICMKFCDQKFMIYCVKCF